MSRPDDSRTVEFTNEETAFLFEGCFHWLEAESSEWKTFLWEELEFPLPLGLDNYRERQGRLVEVERPVSQWKQLRRGIRLYLKASKGREEKALKVFQHEKRKILEFSRFKKGKPNFIPEASFLKETRAKIRAENGRVRRILERIPHK